MFTSGADRLYTNNVTGLGFKQDLPKSPLNNIPHQSRSSKDSGNLHPWAHPKLTFSYLHTISKYDDRDDSSRIVNHVQNENE